MLLRHNPTLKKIYKYYINVKNPQRDSDEEFDSENILGLNFHKFWVFLRDLKVMSPRLTISLINRLFYQGFKNRYELRVPIQELKRKIEILTKNSQTNTFPTIDTNELFVMDFSNKCLENGNLDDQIMNNVNIHDGGRVVLYRHFVELIVRMAFLKYGEINELHRSVEKLITQKIEPLIENKKKKTKDASFHSMVHIFILILIINDLLSDY